MSNQIIMGLYKDYCDLYAKVEGRITELLDTSDIFSSFIGGGLKCLPISIDRFVELVYINGRITALDENGHYYTWTFELMDNVDLLIFLDTYKK